MFNFVNLELTFRTGDKVDNGWWLKIDNEFDLLEWFSISNNFGKIWYDLKMAGLKRQHFKTMEAFLMDFKCSVHPTKTSFSNMDLAQMYNEMKFDVKLKVLRQYGTIYINKVGGFCIPSASLSVKGEINQEELIFPQTGKMEISIDQFPGGTHFYPSVNGVALLIDGVEKYDSKEEAQKASQKYLETFIVKSKEDEFNA